LFALFALQIISRIALKNSLILLEILNKNI